MKDADPIEHVRFYMKNSPMKPVKSQKRASVQDAAADIQGEKHQNVLQAFGP